jgi:hypothetical protein
MTEQISIENSFRNVKEIKVAMKALSDLTGCDEILMKVQVQGRFKIPNRSMWSNELNLQYSWYKVTKIGNTYLTVYLDTDKESYKVYPDLSYNDYDKPRFRIIAENFKDISFSR